MSTLLNTLARLIFAAAFVVLLLALLAVGLVVGLTLWLVALLTGRRRPAPQDWVQRMRQQAEAMRPRAKGEVIDAEVREIR